MPEHNNIEEKAKDWWKNQNFPGASYWQLLLFPFSHQVNTEKNINMETYREKWEYP